MKCLFKKIRASNPGHKCDRDNHDRPDCGQTLPAFSPLSHPHRKKYA